MAPENRLLLLPAGLLLVANLLPGGLMEYDRSAIFRGELWRLWTGQFSHWSPLHLAGNLAAVAGLAVVAGWPIRRWLVWLPVAAPLLSLFILAAVPDLSRYRGLSGLVALLVVGAAAEGGAIGRILAAAYLVKLAFDAASGASSPLLPEGIVTAWPAHLGGLLLGLALALGFHRHAARLNRLT